MSDSDSPWELDSDEEFGPPLKPIHFAVMAGNLAAMRRLLEAGVSQGPWRYTAPAPLCGRDRLGS